MRRLLPIIFAVAITIGVFAPVVALPSGTAGGLIGVATVHATTTNLVIPTDSAGNHVAECHVLGDGTVQDCLARFVYYIPFTLGAWAMGVAATAFDASANFTLSSKLYTAGTFIQEGWRIMRDFSNIFFILILLFIAISLILDLEIGHANPKKMFGMVIVIAVLINFSFFFTEVVIDLSNSLALVFYNQISVVSKANQNTIITNSDENTQLQQAYKTSPAYITDVKPLSIALARSFTPQILSDSSFYEKLKQVGNNGFFSTGGASSTYTDKNTASKQGVTVVDSAVMIPILLMVGIMFCVVAYSFIISLISFIGRLINLWVAIIFAPLAFISFIVPSARHIPGMGWDEWSSGLVKNAFAGPIYFFFLLLISLLAQTSIIPNDVSALSPGMILVLVLLQFMLVITLLLQATKYVKSAAGAVGDMVFKAANFAGKLALGVGGMAIGTAAGVTAFAARNTVGRVGKIMAEDSERKSLAAGSVTQKFRDKNSWTAGLTEDQIKKDIRFTSQQALAKKTLQFARGTAGASFDIRNNQLANLISEKTGMGLETPGMLGLGKALQTSSSAGGFQGATDRKMKKIRDFANSLGVNHDELTKIQNEIANREDEIAELEQEAFVAKAQAANGDENARARYADLQQKIKDKKLGVSTVTQNINGVDVQVPTRYTREEVVAARKAGKPFKLEDVGKIKAEFGYKASDIGLTEKFDGTKVTQDDILKGVANDSKFTGLAGLKKAEETKQKQLANSYFQYQMLNSGYDVQGQKYDALGNIKQLGHYHGVGTSVKDQTRSLARSMKEVLGSAAMGAAIGTAIAGPLIGTIGGALAGLASQFSREMKYSSGELTRMKGQVAMAAQNAGDSHHDVHESSAVYKSPSAGIFSLFQELFKGGGGGGHAGGGHGGGGHAGGGHGGGHH